MVWMLSSDFERRKKEEIRAAEELKRALAIYTIFSIAILILSSILTISSLYLYVGEHGISLGMAAFTIGLNILFLLLEILYLLYIYRGFIAESKFVKNLDIGRLGVYFYGTGAIASFVVQFIFWQPSVYAVFTTSLVIGAIVYAFTLIGIIMIAIAFYRIGKHYDVSEIILGAILMIFLGFIGTLIIYLGFNTVIEKIKRRLPPPPPPWILEEKIY